MRVRFLVLLVGFLLAAAGLTSAGEYSDPSGYGFRYPEGWVAVSEIDRDSVAKEVREWLDNQAIDLTVLSVVVVEVIPRGRKSRSSENDSHDRPLTRRTSSAAAK